MFSIPGVAQQDQKKYTSASLDGATGLFRTWDAETLRKGEFNFSLGANYFNRDPGRLIFKEFPFAIGYGVLDRVELFGSYEFQKSINAPGVPPYSVLPGGLPQPATTLLGVPLFTNPAPFIDVPRASGPGDFRFGGIVNVLSERRKQQLGLSFAGFVKIPSDNSIADMNRGLSNGTSEGGFAVLVSKRLGRAVALHLNLGANYPGSPEKNGIQLTDLQNSFIYNAGIAFPNFGKIQFIAELNGIKYSGRGNAFNPNSPVDAILGFKLYPREWVSVGGGYQGHFNRIDENRAQGILTSGVNGFVAQVTFEKRKHDPPKVTCAVSPQQIIQDEKATVRANVVIPAGATIAYAWAASGGKVTGSGDTATFDATGVAPGKYTVTVTVTDDYKHSVTCTADIIVNKKYLPPTVRTDPPTASILAGDSAMIRAIANSPDGTPLTYAWTVNGQPQAASGTSFNFGSEGRQPGTYTVGVTADTGHYKASASSTVTVTARELPIPPPTIACQTVATDIESGGTAQLSVRATAERATPTVTWTATAGTVTGSGQSAVYNAAGLSAGTYAVTATVDNGHGSRATCNMTVNVSQRIGIPGFAEGKFKVNNVAKAILDNVAVQMKNEPRLSATVAGYIDGSKAEGKVKGLALKRAQAVIDYLVSKGIDASRVKATDGGVSTAGDNKTKEGRAENRRVEIQLGVH
jgi:outer membrane protein OmpA-like peptidoglycan-associated protein